MVYSVARTPTTVRQWTHSVLLLFYGTLWHETESKLIASIHLTKLYVAIALFSIRRFSLLFFYAITGRCWFIDANNLNVLMVSVFFLLLSSVPITAEFNEIKKQRSNREHITHYFPFILFKVVAPHAFNNQFRDCTQFQSRFYKYEWKWKV